MQEAMDMDVKKMNKLELKHHLEQRYPNGQARLKRIESIYIPVTNSAVSKDFFMKFKLITLDKVGNVRLASGQTVFFLPTKEPFTTNFITHGWDPDNEEHLMEGFCFEVEHIRELYTEMKQAGVMVTDINDNGPCGLAFIFQDPDGNRYAAWQPPAKF